MIRKIELAHVCIMNDDLADCGYTVKGVYGSSAVDRYVTDSTFLKSKGKYMGGVQRP